jgi:hypothetical protein
VPTFLLLSLLPPLLAVDAYHLLAVDAYHLLPDRG